MTSQQSDNKELDDALDQLSDSLGQRQPDPDENKPIEDKVKVKNIYVKLKVFIAYTILSCT